MSDIHNTTSQIKHNKITEKTCYYFSPKIVKSDTFLVVTMLTHFEHYFLIGGIQS